jgi:hypothetical protein
MARASYGSVWNFWPFKVANTTATTYLNAQTPDAMILCGVLAGKGNVFRGEVSGDPLLFASINTAVFTVNNSSGFVLIAPPAGGMG